MFHYNPTTDDDAEGIRSLVDTLGPDFEALFAAIRSMAHATTSQDASRWKLSAAIQHAALLTKVRALADLPASIFVVGSTGERSKRIPTILRKIRFLIEDGSAVIVGDSALSWTEPVERLTSELRHELDSVTLTFSTSAKLARMASRRESPVFWAIVVAYSAACIGLCAVSFLTSTRVLDVATSIALSVICTTLALPTAALMVYLFTQLQRSVQHFEESKGNEFASMALFACESMYQSDPDHMQRPHHQANQRNVLLPPSMPTSGGGDAFTSRDDSTAAQSVNSNSAVDDVVRPGMSPTLLSNTATQQQHQQQQQHHHVQVHFQRQQIAVVPTLHSIRTGQLPQAQQQRSPHLAIQHAGDTGNQRRDSADGPGVSPLIAQNQQPSVFASNTTVNGGTVKNHQIIKGNGGVARLDEVTSPATGERTVAYGSPSQPLAASSDPSATAAAAAAAATSLVSSIYDPKMALSMGRGVVLISSRYVSECVLMVGYDKTFNVTLWNSAAEMATGFLSTDVLGRPIDDMLFIGSSGSDNLRKVLTRSKNSKYAETFTAMFNALATPAFSMRCKDVAMQDDQGNKIARLLLCVPEKDTLREQRHYVLAFRSQALRWHLTHNTKAQPPTTTGGGTGGLAPPIGPAADQRVALLNFVNDTDAHHITTFASRMETIWDWASPAIILSRALAPYLTKVRSQVTSDITQHIRIDPGVADVIGGFVGAIPEGFKCSVKARTEQLGKISVFSVNISFASAQKLNDLSFWLQKCNEVGGFASLCLNSPTSIVFNGILAASHNSATNSNGPAATTSTTSTSENNSSIVSLIASGRTSASTATNAFVASAEDSWVQLMFPCQVTQFDFEEDVEPQGQSGGADTFVESVSNAAATIRTQVTVATLLSDPITKHNLSSVLLRTTFVSVTALMALRDLVKAAEARKPIDVVVVDDRYFTDTFDAFSAYGAAERPILINVGSSREGADHTIRTPISRESVDALFLQVGNAIDRRHLAKIAEEERERVLQSRQDSPWTQGRLLGRGAFGAVYEATSDLTGGKMAVKQFYYKQGDDIDSLLNEIRIMCQLKHPHIVHYFYCEKKDDALNLFMELCDSSLQDVIKVKKRVNTPFVLYQVVSAVAYLHEKNIVHRDLKPQNILVKGDIVKLTDFGTAQTMVKALSGVHGSFRFMAPEVYRGEAHDGSCDIWSIGALVCELEQQIPDFMQPRNTEMLATMTTVNLPRGLSGDCLDFVRQCLQLDPQQRPAASMLLLHPYLASRTTSLYASAGRDRRYSTAPSKQNGGGGGGNQYAESLFSLDSDDVAEDEGSRPASGGDVGGGAGRRPSAGSKAAAENIASLFSVL